MIMFTRLLETYRPTHSLLHRWPASAKLIGTLFLILTILLCPITFWPLLLLLALGWLILVFLSGIPLSFYVKRILLLEPFVLGIALLSLLQPEGWIIFVRLITKSTLSLACVVILGATTSFSSILLVLKRFRTPLLLVTTLALMYRYLFVLMQETERMIRARQSRTFLKDRRRMWRNSASLIGQLFLRSMERADRIYRAMSARGWLN